MSNQMEDGWYPECEECGDGNLVEPHTYCGDCFKELKQKIKKEVFDVMDIIINYEPNEYRLKRYEEEKKRHLSTFQKKSDIIAVKKQTAVMDNN